MFPLASLRSAPVHGLRMNADVAIIIVTYNSAQQIAECLESIYQQGGRMQKEVILLDNESRDDTIAIVRTNFPQVTLLNPGRNLGFAAGVNQAADRSRADYVLLLNPDTVVLDNAIETIVRFARANPAYGLYGGRTLRRNGELEPSSCWGAPTLWSLFMFASGLSSIARSNRLFDPESLGRWKRDSVREVGVITGCFLLVARSAWAELRGFDERYFMYGEDVDLAQRARKLGYRPVICPDAGVIHDVGKSSDTPLQKQIFLYQGKCTYIGSHWKEPKRSVAMSLLRVGVMLRAAIEAAAIAVHSRKSRSIWLDLWEGRRSWLGGHRC